MVPREKTRGLSVLSPARQTSRLPDPARSQNSRESMSYARRGVLLIVLFVFTLLTFPSCATLRPGAEASRGLIVGSKSVHAETNVFFSGSFGYSIGGGQAVLKADTVTNSSGTASGPLRFSLWFTSAPFPS